MGFAAVMGVAAGVGVLSDVFSGIEQANAASSAQQAIQLQAGEQQLSLTQQQTANYINLKKSTSAATASAGASGLAVNSPSFNAIQRNIVNNYAMTGQNLDTQQAINQTNAQIESTNVKDQLYGSWLGDVGSLASTAFSAAAMIPMAGGN